MQNYLIETDDAGQELNEHGDSLFPIACYDEYFSEFVLNEVPWHWHEEIELIVVIEGETKLEYVDGSINLKAGDGVLLNSNSLHRLTQVGSINCHIINFVLKPEFIGGKIDSRIYKEYIRPITSNLSLSSIKFSQDVAWEKSIIDDINLAFMTFTEQSFGFELNVRHILTRAWITLCSNMPHLFDEYQPISEDNKRINEIMQFIHNHYNEKLMVSEIAKVANISKSECYRLFNRTMQTTPSIYILNLRLQIAATKLVESDESIINISNDTGFESPSYFSKKFKDQYKLTPRAFRKKFTFKQKKNRI